MNTVDEEELYKGIPRKMNTNMNNSDIDLVRIYVKPTEALVKKIKIFSCRTFFKIYFSSAKQFFREIGFATNSIILFLSSLVCILLV